MRSVLLFICTRAVVLRLFAVDGGGRRRGHATILSSCGACKLLLLLLSLLGLRLQQKVTPLTNIVNISGSLSTHGCTPRGR